MGANSSIGWTDHTFNLWWGCVHDGPECDNCYAEAWAKRMGHYVWGHEAPRRFFGDKHWADLAKWDRAAKRDGVRRRVFVMSMGDIGERLPGEVGQQMNEARSRFWLIAESCSHLEFQLLTKRPQNIPGLVPEPWLAHWPPHVWVGTTAGTQQGLERRGKYLARIPAPIKFLSCEPMLEPLKIPDEFFRWLSWCIIGGESGGKARAFDVPASVAMLTQCRMAGVPAFYKQMGSRPVGLYGSLIKLRHRKGEDRTEWPEWVGPWPQQFPDIWRGPGRIGEVQR